MKSHFSARVAMTRAGQVLGLLALVNVGAAAQQTCATPSDAARRVVDRFLTSPLDSTFRGIHGLTVRSSTGLEVLRDPHDAPLCARMDAAFPAPGRAAYFRHRGLIIGTDARRPVSREGVIRIDERRHVLVFDGDGHVLYLPGQKPMRSPNASIKANIQDD